MGRSSFVSSQTGQQQSNGRFHLFAQVKLVGEEAPEQDNPFNGADEDVAARV
jgi:hypothetical protein